MQVDVDTTKWFNMSDSEEGEYDEGWLCAYIMVGVVSVLWLIGRIINATRSRWFPWLIHIYHKYISPAEVEEIRKEHFASMSSIVSKVPELYKKKSIRILEIGAGTGVNFTHYPAGSHLVVVDPNPNFKIYYDAIREHFPHIEQENFLITTGDRMEAVKDNSVDVVVMTLLLCCLTPDTVDATLKEILRVLVPGGKFYFMEHIAEFDLKKYWWRRQLQQVFTYWIPVWPFVFEGCCLDRETLSVIQRAGFSAVHAQKYYAPIPCFLFDPECPSLKGIAIK